MRMTSLANFTPTKKYIYGSISSNQRLDCRIPHGMKYLTGFQVG